MKFRFACILFLLFIPSAQESAAQPIPTGSIQGHVTIGIDKKPLDFNYYPNTGIWIGSLGIPAGCVDTFFSGVDFDSTGYYRIDSIPVGSVLVKHETGFPPLRPKEILIVADSVIEVDFTLAPNLEGGEREFGFDYGTREAQQMWNMGLATFQERNISRRHPYHLIDSLSGLPITCVVEAPWLVELGFVEGYNSRIYQLIEEFGLPSYTRKPWTNILLDLKSYFESQSEAGLLDTVWNDGPPLFSPDSSYFLLRNEDVQSYLATHYRKELIEVDYFRKGFSEIAWGPDGSNFFIASKSDLVSIGNKWVNYAATDKDDWQPLCFEYFILDSSSQLSVGNDTAQEIGSIEGTVTIGKDRMPVNEARLYFQDFAAEYYATGKEVWNSSEYTDSSGYYRIDSIPVGEATITCRGGILSRQEITIDISKDTVVQQDFVFAPDFFGGMYDYGLVEGRKRGKNDWMFGKALLLHADRWEGEIDVDSLKGLPVVPYSKGDKTFDLGFTQGYNTVIDSLVLEEGLPVGSKKPWLDVILEIESYFQSQEELGLIDTIWQFDNPIVSPDSAVYLRLGIDRWMYSYKADQLILSHDSRYNPSNIFRVIAWGPENSRFYIEKQIVWEYSIAGEVNYIAYDYDGFTILNKEDHIFK